jgi:O-antigen/teichoic acid export membrane protein
MNTALSPARRADALGPSSRVPAARDVGMHARSQTRADPEKARGVYPLYIAATVAPRLAMFVVLIVLTRLLPAVEYGLFALVVTTGEILDMVCTNWIRVYLLRTEAGTARLRPRRLGRALGLGAGGTLVALAASLAIVPLISEEHAAAMTLAVVLYIAAFALLRMTLTMAQLARTHITYAAVECIRGIGAVAVTLAVALMHPHSFLPTSLGLSLVTGLAALVGALCVVRHMPRPVFPRGGYLAALAFGVPFVITSTLFYSVGWFDRFVLNYFIGPAAVGVYFAAFAIARQPVELFVGALNTFTFPLLVRAYATGGAEKAGTVQGGVMTTIAILGVGIVAGLVLLAAPLSTLLFPPSYRTDVALLIPWIAAGTFVLSIKQFVFDNSMHVTQKNWLHLAMMTPPVLVSIPLGILLVRSYGQFGAALNYAVVTVVATLSAAIISLSIFAFAIPWRNLGKVALAAASGTAAGWGAVSLTALWGAAATVFAGAIGFCAVYGAVLTLLGFSLRRLVETPWDPTGARAQPLSTSSNSAR